MTDDDKKVRRRTSIRYSISLEAEILCEGSAPIPCLIVNFCSGGFFLNTKRVSDIVPPLLQKNIIVYFVLPREGGWERIHLNAYVVRVDSDGLGVSVNDMPAAVLNSLKTVATSEQRPGKNFYDRRKASSKANREKFRSSFEKLLHEQLPLLYMEFFSRAINELPQASECVVSDNERTALKDLIVKLKEQDKSISRTFCKTVVLEINQIADSKLQKQAQADMRASALELVTNDDFEDWLNIMAVVRNLSSHYASQLDQLEQKLRFVIDFPTGKVNNPLCPEALCHCFQVAIAELQERTANKRILYQIFGQTLLSGLMDLYSRADQILVELGAPEEIALYAAGNLADKSRQQRGYEDHGAWPENIGGSARQQQAIPQAGEVLALTPSPVPLPKKTWRNKQPVGQTLGNLLNILKEVHYDAVPTEVPAPGTTDGKTQSPSFYSCEELSRAISQLQATRFNISEIHRDSAALHKHLVNTLERSGGVQKILSASDDTKLELYGNFFDTLFNELFFTSDIKSYLETIHLSLIAHAMQGAEFLNTDSHPISGIINKLAFLDSSVKDKKSTYNSRIRQTLDEIVTRIGRESVVNPEMLAEIEQELNEITVPVTKAIETNIGRVITVYENQQKLENVRRLVQSEIDELIAGKSVPKVVKFLLDSGWQDLMVLAELNGTQNGVKKQEFIAVVEDLLRWYSQLHGEQNGDKDQDLITGIEDLLARYSQQESFSEEQITRIRSTLAFIDQQLNAACINAFYLNRPLISELTDTLLGSGSPRGREPLEMIMIEPKAEQPANKGEMNRNSLAEQWQVGDWFLHSREGETPDPLKLVWIGETLDILVLVNREGFKKLELSNEEMADLIRVGTLSKTESFDTPLMERATNLMLQKMHAKLVYHAAHDPVTELFNRQEFTRLLTQEKLKFDDGQDMLCHLELLSFQTIDNVCGISGSDQLLKNLADLISGQLRADDIFARLGDQTFGIFLKQCSQHEGQEIAKRITNRIEQYSFKWEGKSYSTDIGIGLVVIKAGGDIENSLQKANSACQLAKRSGKNRIQLYKDDDEGLKIQTDMLQWVGLIDRVISEERLFIRCQKIAPIDPQKYRHSHYEILLGIKDENNNVIPPDNFIPAVERCQRMPEIDRWVVENLFSWIESNSGAFGKIGGFAINLSGQSLNSEKFLSFLHDRLASGEMPYEKITFEVTETVAAANIGFTRNFIKQVKEFGCKFSLDDFGSGYSSYTYLKDLELDYLKIDGAFVRDIANNHKDVAIVKSINEIGHSLGLETIAEYVEDINIHAILKDIGVDYAQGWAIQKPVLLENLAP